MKYYQLFALYIKYNKEGCLYHFPGFIIGFPPRYFNQSVGVLNWLCFYNKGCEHKLFFQAI